MSLLYWVMKLLPSRVLRGASRLQFKSPAFKAMHSYVSKRLRNQPAAIQRGVGKGLKINIGDSIPGYLTGVADKEQLALYAALVRPGMTVYDAGANIGYHTLVLARLVGPSGAVVSFEPLPENAKRIRENAALNGMSWVTVCEEALADEDGELQFHLGAEVNQGALARGVSGEGDAPAQAIRVTARKLETVAAARQLPPPHLIKMDIEGAEVQALEASKGFLRQHRPLLLVEVHGTNERMEELLRDLGYHHCVCQRQYADIRSNWYLHVLAWPAGFPFLDRFLRDVGVADWE